MSKLTDMRRVFAIGMMFFGLSALAQDQTYPNPLPYNPDSNLDGFIGIDDLLDLLALYNTLYPDSFSGDETGAILDLGKMAFNECFNTLESMGPKWRVMTHRDFRKHFTFLLERGDQLYNMDPAESYCFDGWVLSPDHTPNKSNFWWCYGDVDYYGDPDSTEYAGNYYSVHGGSSYQNHPYVSRVFDDFEEERDFFGKKHCFAVTELKPQVSYQVLVDAELQQLVSATTDSLNNGWNLQGNASQGFSGTWTQTIWRWAE